MTQFRVMLRHRTAGQQEGRLRHGDTPMRCGLIFGWLRHLRGFLRPTGQRRRHGELHEGIPQGNARHGNSEHRRGLQHGSTHDAEHGSLELGGGEHGRHGEPHGVHERLLHTDFGWHGLHGEHVPHGLQTLFLDLQGFGRRHERQGLLSLRDRHGLHVFITLGPRFLHFLGRQDGRQTIILHLDGRQYGGGMHDAQQGPPHGSLMGGGVHSNISSFLANGAPFNLRITTSKTSRRQFVLLVDTLPGASLSLELRRTHFGP